MDVRILVHPTSPEVLPRFLAAQQDPCATPAGAVQVAQTAHATTYDLTGDPAAAQAIGNAFENDYSQLVTLFGLEPPGLPCTIYVEANVGGAYHCGCDATTFFVDANVQLGPSFAAAELVEVFEAAINNGWDCGQTNGEALSRALAVLLHPELAQDMTATETGWWNDGANDYISSNTANDQDEDGNGCGLLFLYYLNSSLGFGWDAIARAGGATLAQTYGQLSGDDPANAYSAFTNALQPFVDGAGNLQLPANGNPWAP
jgi:hypothetical protein